MPVTALLFALATAELDPVERRIVAAIEARQPQALALLERTVEVNSGTMNFAGVRAVGEIFAAELEELGFATRWIDGAPFERAGHLVAARPGGGARVLLIGHLDTVFEADSPFQRFELLDEDRARGPAVTDMKGGIVVMLEALRALAATDVLDDLDLRVVLTGDEEQTGRPLAAAREALREAAAGVEVALGFEDGDGDPRTAVVARRGSTSWQLRVTGLPAHSSQIFTERVGAGAVFETARILAAFYRELAVEKDLTFSPGVIVGGTEVEFDPELGSGTAFGKTNVVAQIGRAQSLYHLSISCFSTFLQHILYLLF